MDAFFSNDDSANAATSAAIVSQSEFTDCVDRCVVSILSKATLTTAVVNEPGHTLLERSRLQQVRSEQAQLRAWLLDDRQALDDGTPIDLALFDSAILSVEERLPATGSLARTRLLSAARQLAETLYVSVRTRVAVET